MRILHIHQDYPDGHNRPFTRAVSSLISYSKSNSLEIEHLVLSINRTSNPFRISIKKFVDGYSIVYWVLPIGFIYMPMLYIWCLIFDKILKAEDIDIVHGHKLTVEGVFAHFLAKKRRVKYILSIRGGSDLSNILKHKLLRKVYRIVFTNSAKIFWTSPWAKNDIERLLDIHVDTIITFPNICEIDSITPNKIKPSLRFEYCTILSFHQYERKGLIKILLAIKQLADKNICIKLNIIGGGDDKYKKIISQVVNSLGLNSNIRFLGKLEHNHVLEILKNSKAMILPSKNETFGMAFIESLSCGTPIISLRNTGIDGYFMDDLFGCALKEQSVDDLITGITKVEEKCDIYHASILDAIDKDLFKKFTGNSIANLYIKNIIGFYNAK